MQLKGERGRGGRYPEAGLEAGALGGSQVLVGRDLRRQEVP